MASLETSASALVCSLQVCADGSAWAACLDGKLRLWRTLEEGGACDLEVAAGSTPLAAALCEELGVIALATAAGRVELYDTSDGTPRGAWGPLQFDGSRAYRGESARSVAFCQARGGARYLVVGGSEGAMHMRWLKESDAAVASASLFDDADEGSMELLPPHSGAVAVLADARCGGLLVSGAHDGTVRIWDMPHGSGADSPQEAKALYGLGGYKVWLGSLYCDGERIISDGSDNMLVQHDFVAPYVSED